MAYTPTLRDRILEVQAICIHALIRMHLITAPWPNMSSLSYDRETDTYTMGDHRYVDRRSGKVLKRFDIPATSWKGTA